MEKVKMEKAREQDLHFNDRQMASKLAAKEGIRSAKVVPTERLKSSNSTQTELGFAISRMGMSIRPRTTQGASVERTDIVLFTMYKC